MIAIFCTLLALLAAPIYLAVRNIWVFNKRRDLIDWQERPVALHPDALGTCFSVSAIAAPQGGSSSTPPTA